MLVEEVLCNFILLRYFDGHAASGISHATVVISISVFVCGLVIAMSLVLIVSVHCCAVRKVHSNQHSGKHKHIKCILKLCTVVRILKEKEVVYTTCLLYTSPSPRDATLSRMPSSA